MFSQHFIECIFHFNSYTKHKSYNKSSQSERYDPAQLDFSSLFPHVTTCLLSLFLFFEHPRRERAHFSLKGEQYREKRFRIYCFLLEHFTDAQRFNITNKINQTILGKLRSKALGFSFQSWACCWSTINQNLCLFIFSPPPTSACFADEELPLDADGANILSETFNILSLKEFKLQTICSSAGAAAGEEAEEENMATMAKAVLQAAQKKVVSQVTSSLHLKYIWFLCSSSSQLTEAVGLPPSSWFCSTSLPVTSCLVTGDHVINDTNSC